MKNKRLVIITILIVLAAVVGFSLLSSGIGGKKIDKFSEEGSKEIAREFIKKSPTYVFDGYNLKHQETLYPDLEGCTSCFTFVFEFTSRHGGYGNRTGKEVTQALTPHEAHITIKNGEIYSALLDLKWDMLNQEMI